MNAYSSVFKDNSSAALDLAALGACICSILLEAISVNIDETYLVI